MEEGYVETGNGHLCGNESILEIEGWRLGTSRQTVLMTEK